MTKYHPQKKEKDQKVKQDDSNKKKVEKENKEKTGEVQAESKETQQVAPTTVDATSAAAKNGSEENKEAVPQPIAFVFQEVPPQCAPIQKKAPFFELNTGISNTSCSNETADLKQGKDQQKDEKKGKDDKKD